jgi:hypothetical protein
MQNQISDLIERVRKNRLKASLWGIFAAAGVYVTLHSSGIDDPMYRKYLGPANAIVSSLLKDETARKILCGDDGRFSSIDELIDGVYTLRRLDNDISYNLDFLAQRLGRSTTRTMLTNYLETLAPQRPSEASAYEEDTFAICPKEIVRGLRSLSDDEFYSIIGFLTDDRRSYFDLKDDDTNIKTIGKILKNSWFEQEQNVYHAMISMDLGTLWKRPNTSECGLDYLFDVGYPVSEWAIEMRNGLNGPVKDFAHKHLSWYIPNYLAITDRLSEVAEY